MVAKVSPRQAPGQTHGAARRAMGAASVALRVLGAAVLAAAVAGCAQNASRAKEGTRTVAPAIIGAEALDAGPRAPGRTVPVDANGVARIALLAPISDQRPQVQDIARGIADAAAMAREDVGDPRLTLEIYDTRGTPEGAEEAARRAIADGAALAIGPLFGRSIAAAGPALREGGLTTLAFSTDAGVATDSVFLLGFLPETEIERAFQYAASQGLTDIAVIAPETPYGQVALSGAYRAAARVGVQVVAAQRYQRDFAGIEAAVREYAALHDAQDDIDAILIADEGQALQTVAAYLNFFDVAQPSPRFLGVSNWRSSTTQREIALRGGWFPAADPNLIAQFNARFEQRFGRKPHPIASLGYDAMAAAGAMLATAQSSGERFPFNVAAITAPRGFQGVNGVFRFQESGLNQRGLAILEVREDRFSVIDPAPGSFTGY